jgi:hypothetical protein
MERTKVPALSCWRAHTYSQKSACQDARKKIEKFFFVGAHYAKSLIFRGLVVCFATSQFVEHRMKSAFWLVKGQLHTKLSTEFVDSEKRPFATEI